MILGIWNGIWEIRGYFAAIIVIGLGLKYKKSKIITRLMCFYSWALIGLNTYTADFASYEEMYVCSFEPRYSGHEPAYMALCKLCLSIGMSYRIFRMVVAAVIVFLTYKGLSYYTKRINYALALYLIFPFVGSASGLRNSFSVAIMLVVSRYLFDKRKKAAIKYILGVLVAMSFHYSSVFYFTFLIVRHNRAKNLTLIAEVLTGIIGFLVVSGTGFMYQIVSIFTTRTKILSWFHYSLYISKLYYVVFILFFGLLFLLYRAKCISFHREAIGIKTEGTIKSTDISIVSKIITVSLIAFAGAISYGVVFLRLITTMIPIGYAVCSNVFITYAKERCDIQKECTYFRVLIPIICFCVALFVYGYWIGGDFFGIYKNNLLFQ